MNFSHSYAMLGEAFYFEQAPEKVTAAKLLLWNSQLANSLQITDSDELNASITHVPQSMLNAYQLALYTDWFSGNQLPDNAKSIALAYSGHQFGHFNPQLGDGRAVLLGELLTKQQQRFDVQLKGSGQTAFSRRGDGKCALGPAIREYVMSEAMAALGVPTTRCLAVAATGETLHRGTAQPGAVVTRTASSHIRVGTFQYFAARRDLPSLAKLVDYSIVRHFPEIDLNGENRIVEFLQKVIDKQITLIVHWLRVGFIHGVMNTDNTAIAGETIDYGPCAMMGVYDPDTVFSSIDEQGRYAFGRQSAIAQWNMARLADCLLMLFEEEQQEQALAEIEPIIIGFKEKFEHAYHQMMAAKLGFNTDVLSEPQQTQVRLLVQELLVLMNQHQLDYTETFFQLSYALIPESNEGEKAPVIPAELNAWTQEWQNIGGEFSLTTECMRNLMVLQNPVAIPRNHAIEAMLATSQTDLQNGQPLTAANKMILALSAPYQLTEQIAEYQTTSPEQDKHYRTFCGT